MSTEGEGGLQESGTGQRGKCKEVTEGLAGGAPAGCCASGDVAVMGTVDTSTWFGCHYTLFPGMHFFMCCIAFVRVRCAVMQVPADVQLPAQVRVWWPDVAVLCQQGAGVLCSHGSIHRVRPHRGGGVAEGQS